MSDLNLPVCKAIFSFQRDCEDLKNRETTLLTTIVIFQSLLTHPREIWISHHGWRGRQSTFGSTSFEAKQERQT